MWILLGIVNVRSFLKSMPHNAESSHSHPHSHGDYIHHHAHGHNPEKHPHAVERTPVARMDRFFSRFTAYRPLRPLVIGIVHGLAGSAAVALLVLATIHNSRWAVAYLLIFVVWTIAGMMLITMSIASAFRLAPSGQRFSRRLALASGLLSLGFGVVVAYQICIVGGLLSAHPQWTPH